MCCACYEQMENYWGEDDNSVMGVNVYCAGVYENILQKLIRGVKYHNQKELAYFQAKFMHEFWQKIPDTKPFYQIVAVPLYKTREKKRKYNHMTLVAEEFAKLSGYKVNNKLVERIKDTKPQYRLNRSQRMENLANAFKVNKENRLDCDILLIDDIFTTGSTFESIINELKKNDINNITCLATTGVRT